MAALLQDRMSSRSRKVAHGARADRIAVVIDGRIAELGSHELVAATASTHDCGRLDPWTKSFARCPPRVWRPLSVSPRKATMPGLAPSSRFPPHKSPMSLPREIRSAVVTAPKERYTVFCGRGANGGLRKSGMTHPHADVLTRTRPAMGIPLSDCLGKASPPLPRQDVRSAECHLAA